MEGKKGGKKGRGILRRLLYRLKVGEEAVTMRVVLTSRRLV